MKQLLLFLLITLVLSLGENASIEEYDIVPGGRSITDRCLYPQGEIAKTAEVLAIPRPGITPSTVFSYRTNDELTYISCVHVIDQKAWDRRYSGTQVDLLDPLGGRDITITFNNRRSKGFHYRIVIKVVTRTTTTTTLAPGVG